MTANLPTLREWLFSGKAFLAAMLALYIALAFDLSRPYWAMAAVYIVSNPLSGATASKGLYRALGTLIGASASVFFVPLFIDSPELLSLVVALWTGTLLYISLMIRTPRSYIFMLAGYSLPIIALPAVSAPETIFDVAVARSEEIILGITCATVIGAVVFPTSMRGVLASSVASWIDDAASWATEILRGEGALPMTPLRRQKLAADIGGLDMLITQLAFDATARDLAPRARELRGRLMMMLPLLSSLADRLHALRTDDQFAATDMTPPAAATSELPAELSALLARATAWFASGRDGDPAAADGMLADIRALRRETPQSWRDLIQGSALDRLGEIIALWGDCLDLMQDIASEGPAGPWRPRFRHRQVVRTVRHYDYGMMLFSAATCVVATLLASAFWIATGWSAGGGAVMMTAVACCFFGALDQPAPQARFMTIWTAVSVLVAAVYLFAILPAIHDFEMLALVFAPPFLIVGLLMSRPQYTMLGLMLATNTASFVAMQNRYDADFASFINQGAAAVAGLLFAYVWYVATRPFGAEIAAWRLVRAGWRDIADAAAGYRRDDPQRLAGRMLDRLGQLVPRLATLGDRELARVDGYSEVRVGFNIIELQKARRQQRPDKVTAYDAVLEGVAALYRARQAADRLIPAPDSLTSAIDRAMTMAIADHDAASRRALDALVGLRRILCPEAPPPLAAFAENAAAPAAPPVDLRQNNQLPREVGVA
ncbi:FUSC family protein [Camelimonas sp. ID_303_24]